MAFLQVRFTFDQERSLSSRLIEKYLNQPYEWFTNKHSSEVGTVILSEVGTLIASGVLPLITVVAQGTVAISLLSLLIFVDPFVAVVAFGIFASAYVIIYSSVNGYLERLGRARQETNELRFKSVNEAFLDPKIIKLRGLERIMSEKFAVQARSYSHIRAWASILSQVPRYLIEGVAFGGVILIIIALMRRDASLPAILPTLSVFAFAGYKLLPALQQVYASVAQLKFVRSSLESFIRTCQLILAMSSKQAT